MPRRIDTQAVIDSVRLEEQGSAPSTPASGYGSLYAKTDGKLYWKDDGGTETDITGAGSALTSSTWTPQLTQPTTVLGITTTANYYIKSGNFCIAHAKMAYDSGGVTAGQPVGVGNLPATPVASDMMIGTMSVLDSSAGLYYHGTLRWIGADSKAYGIGHLETNYFGADPNFALGANDWVHVFMCFVTT